MDGAFLVCKLQKNSFTRALLTSWLARVEEEKDMFVWQMHTASHNRMPQLTEYIRIKTIYHFNDVHVYFWEMFFVGAVIFRLCFWNLRTNMYWGLSYTRRFVYAICLATLISKNVQYTQEINDVLFHCFTTFNITWDQFCDTSSINKSSRVTEAL